MNTYKRWQAVEAELETLYNSPINADTEARIEELEDELHSLNWELDARIY